MTHFVRTVPQVRAEPLRHRHQRRLRRILLIRQETRLEFLNFVFLFYSSSVSFCSLLEIQRIVEMRFLFIF